MSQHTSKTPSYTAFGLLSVLMVLAPLFVLPLFTDFMTLSKQMVLFIVALGMVGAFVVNAIKRGSLQISFSALSGVLGLFGVSVLVSSLVTTPYPVENLLGMGGTYLAMVLVAILGGSLLDKNMLKHFPLLMAIGGSLVSLFSLLQAVGGGPASLLNALFQLQLPTTMVFNLAGSAYVAAQLLFIGLTSLGAWIVTTKTFPKYLFGALPLMLLGLVVTGLAILPGKPGQPLLLPHAASWSVALDTLRAPKTALVGAGIENYETAYNLFKPAWVNTLPIWNVSFTQASNSPFTMLTTAGFFGLITWLLIIAVLWRQWRHSGGTEEAKEAQALLAATLISFGLQFFVSPNMMIVAWQAALLAFVVAATRTRELFINPFAITVSDEHHPWLTPQRQLPGSRYVVAALGTLLIVFCAWGLIQAYRANYYAFAALKAAQQGDAIAVYNNQRMSVALNPYMDAQRQQYALINIQLAAALANKTDITDAEKEQVAQLIQQAIREARAATTLNPERSTNWQVLAAIYRQLIGVAQDADQWTVSAYAQAIQTAPTDPGLRIELGGVFYSQQNYQQALSLFDQATTLKPDMANGFYNAANALKQLQAYPEAKVAYERALALIPADNPSAAVAQKELDEVNAKVAELEASKTDSKATNPPASLPTTPASASGSAQTPLSILDQNVLNAGENVVEPSQPLEVTP